MTKIKIKEIKDPKTNVKINDGMHRIEEIKASITSCRNNDCYKVEVMDMWEDLPKEDQ